MMGWQDAGVALIVLGAVAFLARTVFRRAEKPASGWVPLADVKKKRGKGCH